MKAAGGKRGQLGIELSKANLLLPVTEPTTRDYVLMVLTNQKRDVARKYHDSSLYTPISH
jgi:hypothetical protein